MMFLILCDAAWSLYDIACKTGKWVEYLQHRETCTECKKEMRDG